MPELKYFISDFHFGAGRKSESAEILNFDKFCSSLPNDSHLYILGDFFDFWIEHKYTVRSDFVEIYSILINAKKRGIKISMIYGNHDFMHKNFMNKLGIEVYENKIEFETGDKKVCCLHGDGITGDLFYAAMKSIFRNKFLQSLYKTIHPTISIWFGQCVSKLSRKKNKKYVKFPSRKERYRKYALNFAEKFGFDIMIMGHSHISDLFKTDKKIYANSGVWFENPTYVLLRENKLFLKEFCGGSQEDIILSETEVI